jgi:hypothetical protein
MIKKDMRFKENKVAFKIKDDTLSANAMCFRHELF